MWEDTMQANWTTTERKLVPLAAEIIADMAIQDYMQGRIRQQIDRALECRDYAECRALADRLKEVSE